MSCFLTHGVIWLLITPPTLSTLPSNLSLMACFAGINVSQGVAGFLISV